MSLRYLAVIGIGPAHRAVAGGLCGFLGPPVCALSLAVYHSATGNPPGPARPPAGCRGATSSLRQCTPPFARRTQPRAVSSLRRGVCQAFGGPRQSIRTAGAHAAETPWDPFEPIPEIIIRSLTPYLQTDACLAERSLRLIQERCAHRFQAIRLFRRFQAEVWFRLLHCGVAQKRTPETVGQKTTSPECPHHGQPCQCPPLRFLVTLGDLDRCPASL